MGWDSPGRIGLICSSAHDASEVNSHARTFPSRDGSDHRPPHSPLRLRFVELRGPQIQSPPLVTDVAITGTAVVGQELAGSYVYGDADGDAEGASTYRTLEGGAPEFRCAPLGQRSKMRVDQPTHQLVPSKFGLFSHSFR
jgi:hypothetical protein